MATEIIQRQMTAVQGEQLSLSTTLATLSIPRGRDNSPIAGVGLKCASDFRFQISPRLQAVLKTTDIGVTFTDATAAVEDRVAATVLDISSLSTLANGDYVLVGSNKPFGGIAVDLATVNVNASVMAVHYWNGTAWTNITPTDGTISPAGTSLGADGAITWTTPTDWVPYTISTKPLYWVRITFSAALDATVTVQGMALISKDANRGYGYAGQSVIVPLGNDSGTLEAILGASTATLDITWFFGNLPQMTGAGAGVAAVVSGAVTADTELAAAAALADGATSTPSTATVGAVLLALVNGDATKVNRLKAGAQGGLVIEGAAAGTAVPVSGAVTVSGTATVTQGTAGSSAWPVSIAAGSDVVLGNTTDAVASVSADEDGTARTGIGLFKAIKNLLIDAVGWVAVLGAGTDAVASVSADEDGTARTGIGLFKAIKNLLIDISGFGGGPGVYTTPTHTAPTAGVATGELLAANANRLYALLVNDSDTIVYIKLGAAAVVNQGIRLNANGGSYEMSKKLGNLYTGAINGISGIAGKVVLVTEGV
jgi:hypothetical protein